MAEDYKPFRGDKLVEVFSLGAPPTIKGWNRPEGRPRTDEFDKTLRAEVRDPLWMLTRQWQFGEFIANDAGSPITAKVKIAATRINRYQVKDNAPQVYDESIPLEARVERLEARVERGRFPVNLRLSLQIGRYWFRLLVNAQKKGDLKGDYRQQYKEVYPIVLPDRDEESSSIHAHQEVWQMFAAAAGRSMDGARLYRKIRDGGDILKGITVDIDDDPTVIHNLGQQLMDWFNRQYSVPIDDKDSAWAPSYLEYQFAGSAPDYDGKGHIVLTADEYHNGHLDWYSFDINPEDRKGGLPGSEPQPASESPKEWTFDFIPTGIQFRGMPNVRWWEMEDQKTDFGNINARTTEIAKLLFIEVGLIYANDWFIIPFKLPVGSLARVEGLAVTNSFGERIWIKAAGRGKQDDWQRWAMFNLNIRGEKQPADRSVFIPPVVDRLQESQPLEKVKLIRDEMANMVWGVESRLTLANGDVKDGDEAALELVNYLKSFYAGPPAQEPDISHDAKIRYILMTDVPENWIPLIPVRMPSDYITNREIQLQRAAMQRIIPGSETYPSIRPRTEILRHNIDGDNIGPYFIHEEEVPRAGTQVISTFQRARWHNGKVCVWLGRRKQTGRGEGSSGLKFDQVQPIEKKSEE